MKSQGELATALRAVVGRRHVLLHDRATLRYRRGYRAEAGPALAVVRPGSLVELWRVLNVLVDRKIAIIVQAANTGLTGGSTPDPLFGRPIVIVNTMRLDGIHAIEDGRQVVCLPGATLHRLERMLRPMGREPHSVIGSSCFGASVVGGVCNNSGGALVRRGPAYTEHALFAHVDVEGRLRLVNRLDVDLGDDPETMLSRLEAGWFVACPASGECSDHTYSEHLCDTSAATPARFNADPRRLCDAAGSAGRLIVFAVRLDTFPRAADSSTFYLGTSDPSEFTALRHALLSLPAALPVSAEYLHRDAFDIADRYGRDTFGAIRVLGTDRLPLLFAWKTRIDALAETFGVNDFSERTLQRISRLLPDHLPARLRTWRARYEHHLIVTVDDASLPTTRAILGTMFPSATGDLFECTADEAAKAKLHRFVTAGAAVRYRAVRRDIVSTIVALDVALPRNATSWFGEDAAGPERDVVAVLRYGHFLCHVFHRDYLLARGADATAVKARLLATLELEGAEYPAEHNVGRQYRAKPALADFYRKLDPTNCLNPGIGQTATGPDWREAPNFQGET